jgi:hypothetical protein
MVPSYLGMTRVVGASTVPSYLGMTRVVGASMVPSYLGMTSHRVLPKKAVCKDGLLKFISTGIYTR